MSEVLEEIRSGKFARELFADDDAGRPRFAQLRARRRQARDRRSSGSARSCATSRREREVQEAHGVG